MIRNSVGLARVESHLKFESKLRSMWLTSHRSETSREVQTPLKKGVRSNSVIADMPLATLFANKAKELLKVTNVISTMHFGMWMHGSLTSAQEFL